MSRGGTARSAGPMVVKVGGLLLEEARHAVPSPLDALAASLRHAAGSAILVHGGGAAVDRHLEALGFPTERREGIRITPPQQMDAIAGSLAGTVNKRLVAALLVRGLPAVGLCVGDGALAACGRRRFRDFDPGSVGEIVGGDGRLLRTLLAAGYLPVVSSIGIADDGSLLNLNADDAAAGIARILGARELLLLTDTPGVRGRDGAPLATLGREEIERGIAEGWIGGGMIAKVRGGLAAAQAAGIPVRIASWGDPPRLGLGDEDGSGTRILPHPLPLESPLPR